MGMSEILKETTVWDCDFQANHTYLLDNKGKIIAHAVHGGDKIMISKSGNIKLDKRNYKKKNAFSSYVESTFNQGIFLQPW